MRREREREVRKGVSGNEEYIQRELIKRSKQEMEGERMGQKNSVEIIWH